jgi:hypothetical protein
MPTDEKEARERFESRLREQGMGKRQAADRTESTYARVAARYDADKQHNTHRDVRPKR